MTAHESLFPLPDRSDESPVSDTLDLGDPLALAIVVLEHADGRIKDPSARPDTEDVANRVRLALGYLRQARERRDQEAAVFEALREWREAEESPVRRGFDLDDAKIGLAEAWAKYREQREAYDRMLGRRQ